MGGGDCRGLGCSSKEPALMCDQICHSQDLTVFNTKCYIETCLPRVFFTYVLW